MEVLVKILQFLLSLSLLVMLHELGHFCMAKLFKVRVEKFYIFFNPWFSLFRFKKGETEYGVGWVPLGGYVKISGMIDESMDLEQMKQPAQPYEFRSKSAWQRMLIMLGGVLVNFVLAFVIYIAVLFAWGESYLPTANLKYGVVCDSLFHSVGVRNGDKILSVDNKEVERFSDVLSTILLDEAKTMQVMRDGRVVNIDLPESLVRGLLLASSKGYDVEAPLSPRFRYDGVVADIPPESPAAAAGLRKGDRLLALDGRTFAFYDEFSALIEARRGDTLRAAVLRGADTLCVALPVTADGKIGIYPELVNDFEFAVKYYSFWEAVPAGIDRGLDQISSYFKQFKLFKNPEALRSVGSFITIGNIFPSVWDWQAFWNLTAFLSVVLAIMNLLPIPALDGGHVLFLLYEVVTRRKPSEKFLEKAQMVGMVFLLLLMALAFGNDIVKLFY